ncbi:hypothetical protein IC757_14595 [Wenzhouxiangella sp. AB-CW3]|uniref:hypothetical protein n=1 Tax=Wenzhouxiangella sp. AB-CW3 TaxID=2771012 RepID=UPI00168B1E41|nr:hypothetical protein [Wenzhouxiangella sp. AB-CW3]QOC22229.1 hypothetical protein IC757_14595 [Wenzhouxiangella sp. AB-CW3]
MNIGVGKICRNAHMSIQLTGVLARLSPQNYSTPATSPLIYTDFARIHMRHGWVIIPATVKKSVDDYQELLILTALLPSITCLFIQNNPYDAMLKHTF